MHVCARFWLFAAFGVLFGLAVAGFGIGIYNRYAAQTSASLLYYTEIDTSVAIQNITRIEQSIVLLNTSVNALNLTEIAYTIQVVHNVTRDLYQPFVTLFHQAIFSFNGNTTQPVGNNVDLDGRFGIIVNGWNVNGSILETSYNQLETEVGSLQTLIQVQLTNELVMLENNALRSVNSVVFPSAGSNQIDFTGSCNMSVDTTGRTITFRTCSATPNAYNCSLQLTETQQVLSGINQTLNEVLGNITVINTELLEIQGNIANVSSIISLNLHSSTSDVKVYGPDIQLVNGTNVAVTTNTSGIYVQRTGGIDAFSNTFNQSTSARQVTFQGGSFNAFVTTNNVNTVTVSAASALDNVCKQEPDPANVGNNVFLSTIVNPLVVDNWYPIQIQGGVLFCECNGFVFCSYFTTNCPGFPQLGSPPDCINYQGWLQDNTLPGITWIRFRVPTIGKVYTVQLQIYASLDGTNANAFTVGLINSALTDPFNCAGPVVGTFASSMNLVTTGVLSYYYSGEITFSTDDPEWAPGRVLYLCMYFSGPGTSLPNTNTMTVLPSLIRLA